ncbi:terpene synthase family protein [Streptomyces shenzhenensis]
MTSASPLGDSPLPMPDLSSTFPGPFPLSPHAEHLESDVASWADEFSLPLDANARHVLCNITAQGVACAVPTASKDDLVPFAALFLWLTAFDDVHGEAATLHDPAGLYNLYDQVSELQGILADNDAPRPDNAFALALRHLLAQFRSRASPGQYQQLTNRLAATLRGIVWEARHLTAPERVTVHTYCARRPDTVFVRTVMTAAEIVLGFELSTAQRSFAPVRELETAVGNVAGWINDLASFRREQSQLGRNPLSLPTLIMTAKHLDLPTAFALATGMCEDQAALARKCINELSATSPEDLARHARALEHIVHAFSWHVEHARYRT